MRQSFAFFLLVNLALAVVIGCSGGTGSVGGSAGTPGTAGGNAAPLSARATLIPAVVVPEAERPGILEFRQEFEAEGLQILGDGELVVQPKTPASGWTAELGEQSVLVELDGTFSFREPTDGATVGFLRHPSDPAVVFRFTLSQLRQARDAGSDLVMPFFFRGGCGMKDGDTEDFCGTPPPSLLQARSALQVMAGPVPLRPALKSYNEIRDGDTIQTRALEYYAMGTRPVYGAKVSPSSWGCPQFDGLANSLAGVNQGVVAYAYSTCQIMVSVGGCPNENRYSDAEQVGRLVGLLAQVLPAQDLSTEILPFTGEDVSCHQNHKRRRCDQVNMGDVSCKLPPNDSLEAAGEIVRPDDVFAATGTVQVAAGGSASILIHNNGFFGITKIRKVKDEVNGTLTGEGVVPTSSGQEIRHYRPTDYVPEGEDDPSAYLPDERITFTAPASAQVGQEDVYRFMVDDRAVEITFRVEKVGLQALPPGEVLSLNSKGTVLYNVQPGSDPPNEGLFLKTALGSPLRISAFPASAASLDDEDNVLYKDGDSGAVAIRLASGGTVPVTPPPNLVGGLDAFVPSRLAFVPGAPGEEGGFLAIGLYQTAAGQEAWANAELTDGVLPTQSLNLLGRVGAPFSIDDFSDSGILVGNATKVDSDGFTQIRINFSYNVLTAAYADQRAAIVHDPPSSVSRYVAVNDAGHILVAVQAGFDFVGSHIQGGPSLQTSRQYTVTAMNDDDDVLGVNDAPPPGEGFGGSEGMWPSGGAFRELASLLPADRPEDDYRLTRFFEGSFLILQGNQDSYLLLIP